jgi:hypothetical protein
MHTDPSFSASVRFFLCMDSKASVCEKVIGHQGKFLEQSMLFLFAGYQGQNRALWSFQVSVTIDCFFPQVISIDYYQPTEILFKKQTSHTSLWDVKLRAISCSHTLLSKNPHQKFPAPQETDRPTALGRDNSPSLQVWERALPPPQPPKGYRIQGSSLSSPVFQAKSILEAWVIILTPGILEGQDSPPPPRKRERERNPDSLDSLALSRGPSAPPRAPKLCPFAFHRGLCFAKWHLGTLHDIYKRQGCSKACSGVRLRAMPDIWGWPSGGTFEWQWGVCTPQNSQAKSDAPGNTISKGNQECWLCSPLVERAHFKGKSPSEL